MRFLSADIIYPITMDPIRGGVVVVDDDGIVQEIIDPAIKKTDIPAEIYEGILCPGFVNAHCHLELSHLKGKTTRGTGLTGFIKEIVSKRNDIAEIISEAAVKADLEMKRNGIVAVGDISNSDVTIEVKKGSDIYYHTFVELFDLVAERTETAYSEGLALYSKFKNNNLQASLSPHAPYSSTEELLKLISNHNHKSNGVMTVHNQETQAENEMFLNGSGELLEQFRKMVPGFQWKTPGRSSLKYLTDTLNCSCNLQLVHNTFTRREDLQDVQNSKLFFCVCAQANLYIENALPDIPMLASLFPSLTIGTDSYASNTSLSVADEIKTILKYFPAIPVNDLLKWATLNGAEFLQVQNKFGSLEPGKQPGIINVNWSNSTIKRII